MTKIELESRLEWLTQQRDALTGQLNQAAANVSAFNGAIQECQHWLDKIPSDSEPVLE